MTVQHDSISKKSTSIKLDKKIHKLAKIYAVKHNMQLSDVIGYAIMTYIQVDRRC